MPIPLKVALSTIRITFIHEAKLSQKIEVLYDKSQFLLYFCKMTLKFVQRSTEATLKELEAHFAN